ncbi:MAG TPA: ANTAR domain-containing protein [Candidatus Pullilachnospira intestinigallinarum]|nr:ANTAR domain-containing protein [Candidatus Pullilachnospira intestinigallinarum]
MSVIVVVLPKLEDAKKIRKILISHGFSCVTACQTGAAVLQEIAENDRGLVISGYKLPDMYYRELAECLPPHFELLLMGSAAVVSGTEAGILSITTPVKVYDLVNTVEMVMRQIERRAKKEKKAPRKRSEREENYIRNAKALLMDRNHLTEAEAHRYIQKCSMDNGTNMVETAQMILALMFDEI